MRVAPDRTHSLTNPIMSHETGHVVLFVSGDSGLQNLIDGV